MKSSGCNGFEMDEGKKENRNDYIIHGNMRKKVEKRERSDHDSLPNK